MAETFVSNCASSQRCEACPIGRLQDPEERMWAGEIVRSSILDVRNFEGEEGEQTVNLLREIVEAHADMFNKSKLSAAALGAITIGVSGLCESEADPRRIARMRLKRKPLANFRVTKGRPSIGAPSKIAI